MSYVPNPSPRPKFYRTTLSLPQALATDVALIAKRLGMSQSALLTLLLDEPIQVLSRMVALIPPDVLKPNGKVDEDVVRRLRGQSIESLRKAVTDAMETARQIDPGFEL